MLNFTSTILLSIGFSLTSESQGPLDFASTQLMGASEDSNSLYEPGVKRLKMEWPSMFVLFYSMSKCANFIWILLIKLFFNKFW